MGTFSIEDDYHQFDFEQSSVRHSVLFPVKPGPYGSTLGRRLYDGTVDEKW